MNTHRVNAAAGVIHAAMQQGKSLPQALAYGLEAAGLLQSPETAAELVRLRKYAEASGGRYAELEELFSRLDAAEDAVAWDLGASVVAILAGPGPQPGELVEEVRALRARVAELVAAAYGDAKVRLVGPVEQIRHLHACVAAQMARADTLDRLAREQRSRAETAEARVTELEALEPATYQTCRTCRAAYRYGQPCSNCQFQAQMAAAVAARPERRIPLGHDLPEVPSA